MMTAEEQIAQFRAILAGNRAKEDAEIFGAINLNEQEFRVITIPLTTAALDTNPYVVGFPFRSFIVLDATDSNVSVDIRMNTRDTFQDKLTVKRGGTMKLPAPISKAYISWAAQSGKTITIGFFVRGEFATNILNLVNSGGVVISEGGSHSLGAITLVAATATVIFSADTTRTCGTFRNESGASIWVGPSTVLNTTGFEVKTGEIFEWKNTSALYGYSVLGCSFATLLQGN